MSKWAFEGTTGNWYPEGNTGRWYINNDYIGKDDVVYFVYRYPGKGPHGEIYFDAVWLGRDAGSHVYFHSEMAIQDRGSPYTPKEYDYYRVVRGLFEGKVHQK